MVPNFQVLVWGLQGIAAVVVIAVGIPNIVKQWKHAAPASRAHFVNWTASWSPFVFNLCGLAVWFIWKDLPFVAAALFTSSFVVQIVSFRRDPRPVNRDAVVMFGFACCVFTFLTTFVFMFYFTSKTLEEIGSILEMISKIAH